MDTEKRKTLALVKFSRFMSAGRLTVITYDEERTIDMGEVSIEVIPAWKWILSGEGGEGNKFLFGPR
jgi:predicted AAA+ superfamily ATPase